MSEITSWEQTPAGLLRNGGLLASPGAVEIAQQAMDDRQVAKRAFDEAWKDPVNPAYEGGLAFQRALVERGWQGAWITVGPSRPPELEPMWAADAAANGVVVKHTGPDGTVTYEGGSAEVRARLAEADRLGVGRELGMAMGPVGRRLP